MEHEITKRVTKVIKEIDKVAGNITRLITAAKDLKDLVKKPEDEQKQ